MYNLTYYHRYSIHDSPIKIKGMREDICAFLHICKSQQRSGHHCAVVPFFNLFFGSDIPAFSGLARCFWSLNQSDSFTFIKNPDAHFRIRIW